MRHTEIKTQGITIRIYGSKADQEYALNKLSRFNFIGNEQKDRITIMRAISALKIKASVLYEGNTVYDNDKILKNLRAMKRQGDKTYTDNISDGMLKMTKYTYQWLINATGSIAHYNQMGWIQTYPTVKALKNYFHSNEWSKNIYEYAPMYNSSNKTLALEVLKIFK